MAMVGAMPGYQLLVHIVRAEGLKHMNNFTADHPYCVCEVQHHNKSIQPARVETQPMTSGDTLNPVWDEAWEIEPWYQGESLEFTVYDKGLMGSKTEGKVVLPSETFFPNGFSGMLSISDLGHATLHVEIQIGPVGGAEVPAEVPAPVPTSMTYGAPTAYSNFETSYTYNTLPAPQMMCAAPPMLTYGGAPTFAGAQQQPMAFMAQQPMAFQFGAPPIQPPTKGHFQFGTQPMGMVPSYPTLPQPAVLPMPAEAQLTPPVLLPMPSEAQPPTETRVMGPQKIAVSILQAHGLKHLNHFAGDSPFVTCEVKSADGHSRTKVETKPQTEGDTMNPFWGETFTLDPWNVGDNLEFSVFDKGLICSKTEGKVVLPHDMFYPVGFSGMLLVSGLPHALLHIIVRPLGPSSKVDGATLSPSSKVDEATLAATTSNKQKKTKLRIVALC